MNYFSTGFYRASLIFICLSASACGGGGGGSNLTVGENTVTPTSEASQSGQMLSFEGDIEPILQSKCQGCHNSGDNPLAPFSLEGIQRVNSLKSAILYVLDTNTMPPADAQQLTGSEHAKLKAWLTDEPYTSVSEILRIALVEPKAWAVQPKNRDVFLDHRPVDVDCLRDTGWLAEEDALEVRTAFCNYLSITQQSLLDLKVGTELELILSHSDLDFNAPATAHVAVSIAGTTIWETTVDIPSDNNIIKETLVLPIVVNRGDPIEVHLHNHGDNTWTIHSLDAFISSDEELIYCPSFDSTFEAIQTMVFEQAGCANSLCHGEAKTGGLDLSPLNAYDNLVGVSSAGSSLSLVEPREPARSYFYHKLSAKTFPGRFAIDGSPMPSAGAAISPGQLEAIRLWIEAGAPREGSVGDSLGRGEDELERLLGVCLPEAEAVNTVPLPPPSPDKGLQYVMPPHDVAAEKEREICFAVYEDFRDVIPPEYMDEAREYYYVKSGQLREDAFTHHNILYYSTGSVDKIHDPSFGGWTCAGGEKDSQTCEPTDLDYCGAGQCRSEIKGNIACTGFGPRDQSVFFGQTLDIRNSIVKDGFYEAFPTHGIYYWNSHSFNLTTEDGVHHVWRNMLFADDRRFEATRMSNYSAITAGAGTLPFTRQTVCADQVLNQGDGLLSLSSHTHKRGERFSISIKGAEEIYETFTYDEPLDKVYEPAMVFNSSDPAERTLEYCATYNNGVNKDGSFNLDTVTRLSRRPTNASSCNPVACVEGNIGASCDGAEDDASCDSSPGAGDGWCDACAITPGVSSDDEMFVLLGTKLADHDILTQ
jgi:hypothetical protein